ncbi:MAG: trypsin-like peptidase domain-containing protein, partial [Candidatus Sericytochromatia bacterium]
MKQPAVVIVASLLAGFAGGYLGVTLGLLSPTKPPVAAMITPSGAMGRTTIVDLVQAVGPAVVNIDTVSRQAVAVPMFRDPFTGEAFGPRVPAYQERKGVGSGFVIHESGLIVTNDHVVKTATALTVTWPDGQKLQGRVVAREPRVDLAFVKVEAAGLQALELATEAPQVGQYVVAIGSPLGLQHSVSAG